MSTRNEGNLDSIVYARVPSEAGEANLAVSQQFSVPRGLTSEFLQIPSASLPQFGSVHVYDLKQKGLIVHNLSLLLNCGTLTGISGTQVRMIPAFYWISRCEIVVNGSILDTFTGEQNFLKQQIIMTDDDRCYINNGGGSYSTPAQRVLMASTSGQDYVIPLHSLFDEASLSLLTDSHQVQLRVHLKPIADLATANPGFTGTGIMSINSAFLLAKTSRMDSTIYAQRLLQLQNAPENYLYHDTKFGLYNLASGISQTQVVLSAITGRVSTLVFFIKQSNALTGDNCFNYMKIRNFSILNSNNTNISTGAPISDHTYANYIAPFISDSSYLSEQANGATNYGSIQNTGAKVYAYTFTHDNVTCLKTGITSSSVEFKGNEQLVLTFSSPLATSCILEVYAFCESALEFGETSVVKLTL